MDRSLLQPGNLIAMAFELQWPAMLLALLTCAVAWVNRIKRVPERIRAATAWISSPGVLIAAPVYLWGCRAAFDSIHFFDALARSGMSSQMGFVSYLWATSISEFLALFAILFPGTVTALGGNSAIKARDVAGVPWAIGAVAPDYLLSLVAITPIGR